VGGSAAIRRISRTLYITALAIFVITIVIGILNGIDLVAFSTEGEGPVRMVGAAGHRALVTHLHAGTLGFLTLAIVAGVFRMFTGGEVDEATGERARWVGLAMAWTIALYVVAFALTEGVLRPVTGALVFVATILLLVWVVRRMWATSVTVAQLAVFLALVELVLGAIFGILVGIFVANGSVPGLSAEIGERIYESHPATMLIGYLVLAALVLLVGGLVALTVIVQGVIAGKYAAFEDAPEGLRLAMDHMNFIGAVTMVTLGLIAARVTLSGRRGQGLLAGINVGLALFVLGLLTDATLLERIGTPIMGVALLLAVWWYVVALRREGEEPRPTG